MLVSSMLLWANIVPIRNEFHDEFLFVELLYGWPFIVLETEYEITIKDNGLGSLAHPRRYLDGGALLIDVAIAFLVLVATWFVLEIIVKRFRNSRSDVISTPHNNVTGDKRKSSGGE